eukprot:GILK01000196.1.p1 GENE.GILK01000196.1~~GILK01000196.1.p1  ORF type:complete len:410 (+),score=85.68 GILK01000196.1:152-1231(+)
MEETVMMTDSRAAMRDFIARGLARVEELKKDGWDLVPCKGKAAIEFRKCISDFTWVHVTPETAAPNKALRVHNMIDHFLETSAPGYAFYWLWKHPDAAIQDSEGFNVPVTKRTRDAGRWTGHNLYDRDSCDVSLPAARPSTFIDFNITLPRDRILSWNAYFCRPGKIRFQVFRAMKSTFDTNKNDFDAIFTLVGQNEFEVKKPGKHHLTVEEGDRFEVLAGDYIGWTLDPMEDGDAAISVSPMPSKEDRPYANVGVFDGLVNFDGNLLAYQVATIRTAIYSVDVTLERQDYTDPYAVNHDEKFTVDLGPKSDPPRFGVWQKNGPHDPFSAEPDIPPKTEEELEAEALERGESIAYNPHH